MHHYYSVSPLVQATEVAMGVSPQVVPTTVTLTPTVYEHCVQPVTLMVLEGALTDACILLQLG